MADETNGPVEAAPYRVLARKYRPQSFDDLIGQEPVVRTLTNAFEAGRIAQAWMLTGVRGVGKTTTARILARALNYETDAVHRPTIHMREEGVHDRAIMEGRHVDVVEMDAASHTGIDDIREIIAQVRYKPVSARYKVYIIDEVHMLSTQAFNGLLKTLEEPPEHVKFVFATTEIRKVPVTVLSRCQRFDLRRVEPGLLIRQLEKVLAAEAVEAEAEALRILARAAEGSVRDALSLTDQAIAHGGGRVTADAVRDMLGLADRVRIIDLFEQLMRGDARTALRELGEQYASGADPVVILSDLADFTHLVTTLRYVPEAAEDVSLTPAEATRGRAFAASLSVRTLSQVWQMLLKAVEEARNATSPRQSAEMALIRIAHAADLPAPDDLLRLLQAGCDLPAPGASPVNGGAAPGFASAGSREPIARNAASPASGSARGFQPLMAASAPQPATLRPPSPQPEPEDGPRSLRDIEALAGEKRDSRMRVWIRRYLRPVRMEPGRLEVALAGEAPVTLAGDLGRRLHEWTGRRWVVTLASEGGGPTIEEEETARREALLAEAAEDPDVAAVLDAFPGAVIREVRLRAETDAAAEEIEAESAPETASLAETLAPDDVVEFDTGDDLEPVGEPDPGLDDDDDDDEL